MVFTAAILVGALFAWIALRSGFFATWILFFNILLAITVAIFVTPKLLASIPDVTKTPYGCGLTLLGVAVGILLLSYGTCFALLAGRFNIEFHRICDTSIAGLLGFTTGVLLTSFVGLVVCLTPIPHLEKVQPFGLDGPSQRSTLLYLCWWCDRLHDFVRPLSCDIATADAVSAILAKAEPVKPDHSSQTPPQTPAATQPAAPPPSPAVPEKPPVEKTAEPKSVKPVQNETTTPAAVKPEAPTSEKPANSDTHANDSAESLEKLLSIHKTLINSADAIEGAIHKPETRILELSETLTSDRFSPHAIQLLQTWVSEGGTVWVHNNTLHFFNIGCIIPSILPADTHCSPSKQHSITTGCQKVVLQPCVQQCLIIPSDNAIPLLTSDADLSAVNLKAGQPLWSLAPYGKGWVSDPKPIDQTRYEGARFWRNFCLFCLKMPIPVDPSTASESSNPSPQSPSTGILTGQWQSIGGALFRIEDDGETANIELMKSDTLLVCSGKMTRQNGKNDLTEYSGKLTVILIADAPKQSSVNLTATLLDSNHLRLVCSNWPKPKNSGGSRNLVEIWTRQGGSIPTSIPQASPKRPQKPQHADSIVPDDDPFATKPGDSNASSNWP